MTQNETQNLRHWYYALNNYFRDKYKIGEPIHTGDWEDYGCMKLCEYAIFHEGIDFDASSIIRQYRFCGGKKHGSRSIDAVVYADQGVKRFCRILVEVKSGDADLKSGCGLNLLPDYQGIKVLVINDKVKVDSVIRYFEKAGFFPDFLFGLSKEYCEDFEELGLIPFGWILNDKRN